MEENNQNINPIPPVPPVDQTSLPPVIQTSAQTSPVSKSKSKLPILIIGIILFLLIAGSAVGFYVFKQQATANWKTYTNTKYGYSFKYPKEWHLDIYPHSNERLDQAIEIIVYTGEKTRPNFMVGVSDVSFYLNSPNSYTLVDFIKSKYNVIDTNILKQTNVNGYKGYSIIAQGETDQITFLKNKKNIYSISLHYTTQNNDIIINQILATFKFTN